MIGTLADAVVGPAPALEISPTGVLLFLGIGVALLGTMRLLRYWLRVTRLDTRRKATLATGLTVVETVAGLIYVVAAVPLMFQGRPEYSPWFAVLVIVGVLWVSWVGIRDLVHGVFFKAGKGCRHGDVVALGDSGGVRGRIRRLGYRVLVIATPAGEEVLIPYSRLTRETLVRLPKNLGAVRHAFRMPLPGGAQLPDVERTIALAAFNHHWASVAHPPQVALGDDGALEVGVYALDAVHGPGVEAAVRQALRELEG